MKYLDYRERIQHGTFDFPIALYKIDIKHPRYDMMYHWHPECELIRIKKGQFSITLDGKEFVAGRNDVIYITDGVLHGGHSIGECEYECLVFDAKGFTEGNHISIRQMENLIKHKRIVNSIIRCDDEINSITNSLFNAMNLRFPGYEFAVIGSLMQFYSIVIKKHLYSVAEEEAVKSKEQQMMLKEIITFIEDNYYDKITLPLLAKKAGMSPKYFCSVFYKMTQKTPIEYLNAYRIECACEKLITTDKTVTEIALFCGFNDVSYFTKTFRKYKNKTPLQYRKSGV